MSYHSAKEKCPCPRRDFPGGPARHPDDYNNYIVPSDNCQEACLKNLQRVPRFTQICSPYPTDDQKYNIEDIADKCMMPRPNKVSDNPPAKYTMQDLANMRRDCHVLLTEEQRARHEVLSPDKPCDIYNVPEYHPNYMAPLPEKYPRSLEEEQEIYGRVKTNRPHYTLDVDACKYIQRLPTERVNYAYSPTRENFPDCIKEMEERDKPPPGHADACDNTPLRIAERRRLCSVKKNLFNPVLPTLRRMSMDNDIHKLPDLHTTHTTFARDIEFQRRLPHIECDIAYKQPLRTNLWKKIRETTSLNDQLASALDLNNPWRERLRIPHYTATPNDYLDFDIGNPKYEFGYDFPRLGRWPHNLLNLPPPRVPCEPVETFGKFCINECKNSSGTVFVAANRPCWWP